MKSIILSTTLLQVFGHYDGARMEIISGDGSPCFAYVEIDNRSGVYNEMETLQTPLGEVSLTYRTNGGHNATDFDEVFVELLPEGVAASPLYLPLPDGDKGRICLMTFGVGA